MIQENTDNFSRETLPYIDALWRTALWITTSDLDAEKLVEDVYVEAIRVWDQSVPQAGIKARMLKILIKVFFKEKKANFAAPVSEAIENEYRPFPTDKLSIIGTIPKVIISNIIKGLPIENRLVIALSVFEKITYPEIADIVGVSRKIIGLKIYEAHLLIHRELYKYVVEFETNNANNRAKSLNYSRG